MFPKIEIDVFLWHLLAALIASRLTHWNVWFLLQHVATPSRLVDGGVYCVYGELC